MRLAFGVLSVVPVRFPQVDRASAGRAMVLAPLVGLVLGGAAALVMWVAGLFVGGLLPAVLAVGVLALLTRGLHLDGLADLADGLGSGKPADGALDIMKKSDIGPFGVMTLIVVLLVQVTAAAEAGPYALVVACVTGRLAITWACGGRVPAARPGGLGAMVAGSVTRTGQVAATAAVVAGAVLLSWAQGLWAQGLWGQGLWGQGLWGQGLWGQGLWGQEAWGQGVSPVAYPVAVLAGLAAAWGLRRHAVRRLGGITGDVLGALTETAAAVSLVVAAAF
ncbi:adenosylcobinamide-GDP ribazoletransferase [Sinosporangium album]|uniref:adenosylcobinamide-GDP ribazoletransferase n=1 Tax=Sinosporangium album TaxID=504805 RepID=UPI000B89D397